MIATRIEELKGPTKRVAYGLKKMIVNIMIPTMLTMITTILARRPMTIDSLDLPSNKVGPRGIRQKKLQNLDSRNFTLTIA
jgi:hypothetical protein